MRGEFKSEPFAIEVPTAPTERLIVDVNTDILATELGAVEVVVAEMMSVLSAAAPNVDNRRIHRYP